MSLLGGTSQGYHLCIYHLDSNLKKVLDTTVRPNGYSFLPEFIANGKSLTIRFETYDDHTTQTYVWNPNSKKLEGVMH